jgi:signal transduction histidine kinase
MVRISVSDNGAGIPDEEKSIVFYEYFQRSGDNNGKGLGLHIVKSIVDRYDGEVWIEDRIPGDAARGTRVVIQIPEAYDQMGAERYGVSISNGTLE